MDDQDAPAALERIEQLLTSVAAQVGEMHAELDEFRPLLRLFRPGNGASDMQRAGLARSLRKAARGG
jgi:hypothetical protein